MKEKTSTQTNDSLKSTLAHASVLHDKLIKCFLSRQNWAAVGTREAWNDEALKSSPFEQVGGGDEAGAGCGAGQFLGLPPEGVCLVHNLKDVTFPEAHAGVGAGDARVLLGAVVRHGPHVQLTADGSVHYEDI